MTKQKMAPETKELIYAMCFAYDNNEGASSFDDMAAAYELAIARKANIANKDLLCFVRDLAGRPLETKPIDPTVWKAWIEYAQNTLKEIGEY